MFFADAPALFLEELKNANVPHLETATFTCKVSPRDQVVVWYLDDEIVTSGDRFSMSHDDKYRSMTVKDCTVKDRYINALQPIGSTV